MPKTTKKPVVIFDMDGVIVESESVESEAWETILKEHGKKPKYKEGGLIHTAGLAADIYQQMIDEYSLNVEKESLKKKKRKLFKQIAKKRLKPISGFHELIKKIKKEKLPVGIASNRIPELIHIMLKKIDANNYFDVIIGSTKDIKHKPAPDIYLRAAERLKAEPSICIAIEDTQTGVASGKMAGMKVIAVPTKYTKSHDFSRADKIVGSLSEIKMNIIYNL